MNQTRLYTYIISILVVSVITMCTTLQGQDTLIVNKQKVAVDSLSKASKVPKNAIHIKSVYGLRLGVDISHPIIQLAQSEDLGFELTADYRLTHKWYLALESGYESEPGKEPLLRFHTKGGYAKIGFNYNTYDNWYGSSNEIYIGLRYAYSYFSQKLLSYKSQSIDNYFEAEEQKVNQNYKGLNGHWAELVAGIKVEVLKNFYLTAGVQYKNMIYAKQPEDFTNLYIPGFTKVLLHKNGIWFNYTLAYTIPIKKK